MKTQTTALLIGALLICAQGAQPIYFLVTRFPNDEFKESFVVPLYEESHITHARELIEITKRPEWWKGPPVQPVLIVNVTKGNNLVNCNYAIPEFPEWSWHATEVYEFIDFASELPQFPHELEELYTIRGRQEDLTIAFESFTITRELGPLPLEMSLRHSDSTLDLNWSRPGTNFLYTIQEAQIVPNTPPALVWTDAGDTAWPISTNHWRLNLPTKSKLFRVIATASDLREP